MSYGISFTYCLLEDPGIWDDLEINQDNNQLEPFMSEQIFTPERINAVLTMLTMKYLLLTQDEVAEWDADSLAFFISMKSEDNFNKGNFLREKANRLVAAIQLRFEPLFNQFCQIEIVQKHLIDVNSMYLPSSKMPLE